MNQPLKQPTATIAVIGGGLGGCLTAIMLAKKGYNVKLIEAQDTLLNGASRIAARLHLGGEYPKSPETAEDCLESAVIWKLLMPQDIYTSANKMKFLVSDTSSRLATMDALGAALNKEEKKSALDPAYYLEMYQKVMKEYKSKCDLIHKDLRWSMDDIYNTLFGAPENFVRPLEPQEYKDYPNIAGGFQSQEHGLDSVRYLAMIQYEIERLSNKEVNPKTPSVSGTKPDPHKRNEGEGKIEVLLGHKVKPAVSSKKNVKLVRGGIQGSLGDFEIYCTDHGKDLKDPIHAQQVVNAAWSGGPAIVPELNKEGEAPCQAHVHRRAMMVVDLPEGWKTDPAFVMLGASGGMVSPFNEKTALVYLPREETAYIKTEILRTEKPNLSENWTELPDLEERTQRYFELAQKQFPFLKGATNPRLLLDDTIDFYNDLTKRPHKKVEEARVNPEAGNQSETSDEQRPAISGGASGGITLSMGTHQLPQTKQMVRQTGELKQIFDRDVMSTEIRKGLFNLYPTKATYCVNAALQTALMVDQRYRSPGYDEVTAPNILPELLMHHNMERYSLAKMELPQSKEFWDKFFKDHPDLRPNMMSGKLPEPVQEMCDAYEARQKALAARAGDNYWQNSVAGGRMAPLRDL